MPADISRMCHPPPSIVVSLLSCCWRLKNVAATNFLSWPVQRAGWNTTTGRDLYLYKYVHRDILLIMMHGLNYNQATAG
jgi:hypothetical protein